MSADGAAPNSGAPNVGAPNSGAPNVGPTIRVMIVDDHELVRSGLENILRLFDDIELVAQADSGAQAVRSCGQARPDVVLMDLVMPGMNGVAATEVLLREHPGTRVLALTSFSDEELIEGALRAGAIGYLLKNISGAQLADAIRAAHAGRSTLAPEAAEALIHVVSTPTPPAATSPGASVRCSLSWPRGCRTPTSPTGW